MGTSGMELVKQDSISDILDQVKNSSISPNSKIEVINTSRQEMSIEAAQVAIAIAQEETKRSEFLKHIEEEKTKQAEERTKQSLELSVQSKEVTKQSQEVTKQIQDQTIRNTRLYALQGSVTLATIIGYHYGLSGEAVAIIIGAVFAPNSIREIISGLSDLKKTPQGR